MVIMLFFLALISGTSAQSCYNFTCNPEQTYETCSSFDKGTITESPCIFGLYCNSEDFNGDCDDFPEGTRYPGDFCSSNEDCISDRCYSSGTCSGKLAGVSCSSTVECIEGTYCASGKCAQQLEVGQTCLERTDCVNTAICDNGKCVGMFSLAIGVETYVLMEPNFFPACKTGYANVSDTSFICDTAPVSANKGAKCTVPSKCMATDGVNYKFCECGLDGNGYCPLFEGDTEVQNMITAWKTLVSESGTNVCHAMHPFNYACYVGFNNSALLSTFLNYIQYVELYFKGVYTKLPGSNTCQQQTNLPEYTNVMLQISGNAPKCPIYNKIVKETNDTCVIYNENIYNQLLATAVLILDCNQSSVCSSQIGSNGVCVENILEPNLPGQNCSLSHNCLSNNCVNFKCVGAAVRQACTSTKDCNVGLYCQTGQNPTCESVKMAGEACSASIPCASNLLCDDLICVALFSKLVGANTTVYSDGLAMACSTGFAIKVSTGIYTCEIAPTSNPVGASCDPSTTCKDTSAKYQKSCVCAFDGSAYCSEFEGDSHLQTAIENYKLISEVTCNLALGLTAGCFEGTLKNSLHYYYYYTNMTQYQSSSYFKGTYDKRVWINYFSAYNTALSQIKLILDELHPSHDDSSSSSSFGVALKAAVFAVLVLVN